MSYFQLATTVDNGSFADLNQCLAKIAEAGVEILKQDKFDSDGLVGYNVYVQDVSVDVETTWQKKIIRIVKEYDGKLCERFRFKGWSY